MRGKFNLLIQTLKNAPEIISDYVLSLPEKDLDVIRGDGFWTIRKHVIHLEYGQNILSGRIKLFNQEAFPVVKPYFPDKDEVADTFNSIGDVLESFRTKRNRQIELINQLSEADLKKTAQHDEYKQYSLVILLNHILFHDYWHMYRIEELWLTKDEYLTQG